MSNVTTPSKSFLEMNNPEVRFQLPVHLYNLKEFSKLIRFFRPKLKHMKVNEIETDAGFVLGNN